MSIRVHRLTDRRTAEAGSAYLFALLALLVLTVIGLSLIVVTQTEVQIGGAEKSNARALYGADSGMNVQLVMYDNALDQPRVQLYSDALGGGTLTDRVDMAPMYPIYKGPCNLCSINVGGDRYWAINFATAALSTRLATSAGGDENVLAQKLLSRMFYKQPSFDLEIRYADREYESSSAFVKAGTPGLFNIPQ